MLRVSCDTECPGAPPVKAPPVWRLVCGKYNDSELQERIKEKIKQSDKGGRPGRWSAHKGSQVQSIEDYDDLSVDDVRERLADLSDKELGRYATTRSTRTASTNDLLASFPGRAFGTLPSCPG
jgi:hypothetical protein